MHVAVLQSSNKLKLKRTKPEKYLGPYLPTKLTVANLAGTLDRYVLDNMPTCGGIAGNAEMCDFTFSREGANV